MYWCPVNLYERRYKRRVLGQRIEGVADAVGKTYPAVDETYPAVDVFSHGIYFWRGGG